MRLRFSMLCSLGAALLAIAGTSPVRAITISVTSANLGGANTADVSSGANTDKGEFRSSLSTLVGSDSAPGYLSDAVTVATRYAAVTQADKDSNTFLAVSTKNQSATSQYSVTVSVTPDFVGQVYSLSVNTLRFGDFDLVNDSNNGSVTLNLGSVAATYTGPGTPVGSNNLGALSYTSPNSNSPASLSTAINQSGVVTISGLTGPQVFTFGFTWTSSAASSSTAILGNSTGDDGAIRLGESNTNNGSSGKYPGTPSRGPQSDDGHFLNVTATITAVPEPSTFALLGLGLIGLAAMRFRRK